MKNIFLSHTSADKAFVERLAIDLRMAGLNVWFDAWEIKVGDSIVEKINDALTANDCLVLILSPRAVASDWVRRELNSSLMRNLSKRSIKVLPVLYEICEIPPIIVDLKYADFTSDYSKGLSELYAALELVSPIPAFTSKPKSVVSVVQASYAENQDEYKQLFPYSFADYPECLFKNGMLDVAIIVGSTEREHSNETVIFNASNIEINLYGTKWSFSRQVAPGTVRDTVRAVDLAAYLGFSYGRFTKNNDISWPNGDDSLCVMDTSVSADIFNKNVILVGGADTNVFIAIATLAFRQKFGYSLPIRYFGDEQLYFTCDQIYSELSNQTYSRLEDLSFMHCGYLLMVANPWAHGKVLIFAVGTRATGTQAALLALMRNRDMITSNIQNAEPWHSLTGNNRFYPNIPAKVVRASKARIIDGESYINYTQEITVPDKSRISQRHIITDFEFME